MTDLDGLTWPHIFAAICSLIVIPTVGWVLVTIHTLDSRLSVTESKVAGIEESLTRISTAMAEVEARSQATMRSISVAVTEGDNRARSSDLDLRTGMRRIDDKISQLLIKNYNPVPIVMATPVPAPVPSKR